MLTDELRRKLIEAALTVRSHSYAPYSNYAVGAALLTESERVYTGVNIENAAYPTSMCAERVAVFKAVSEGERQFRAIAVATANAGTPCGSCRQVLSEFGLEILVIVINEKGEVIQESSVSELLPGAFGPQDLGIKSSDQS
ncbi:MAG: cytidine deaminase [Anaerolineales bacterium]|nr:cytidine deaminase [Anaerolineales bacterium]